MEGMVPRKQWEDLLAKERELSEAYVRLRVILGAVDAPNFSSPKQLWAYVESVAKEVVARASKSEPEDDLIPLELSVQKVNIGHAPEQGERMRITADGRWLIVKNGEYYEVQTAVRVSGGTQ